MKCQICNLSMSKFTILGFEHYKCNSLDHTFMTGFESKKFLTFKSKKQSLVINKDFKTFVIRCAYSKKIIFSMSKNNLELNLIFFNFVCKLSENIKSANDIDDVCDKIQKHASIL